MRIECDSARGDAGAAKRGEQVLDGANAAAAAAAAAELGAQLGPRDVRRRGAHSRPGQIRPHKRDAASRKARSEPHAHEAAAVEPDAAHVRSAG